MKALVLSSGGVDSTTCLGLAIERFGKENVIALAITYGQKHTKEVEAAQAVAQYYGIELLSLDLSTIFRYDTKCTLLQGSEEEIPEESYAEQLKKTDGKPVSTYVPFRNGLFQPCDGICLGNGKDDLSVNKFLDYILVVDLLFINGKKLI